MCAFAVYNLERGTGSVSRPNLMVITLFALILTAPVMLGQTFRARVQGLVTDESKAAVAGASVTLLNINTGTKAARLSP